jgi:hypothetical protein
MMMCSLQLKLIRPDAKSPDDFLTAIVYGLAEALVR